MVEDSNENTKQKKKSNHEGGTGAFGLLGLDRTLCYALEHKLRYKQPSTIQRRTIPAVLQGRDVVCIARTGSGKTAAYLAPVVQLLEGHSRTVGVRCLILLPTRELALQVSSVLKKFIAFTKRDDALRSATLIGGESVEGQFGALTFNPDLVVATPGRLSQHIAEKSIDLTLVTHFVIDEADKLFEMGFMPDVYRILSRLPEKRQTMLVSATLPSELTEFVNFGLRNPVIAQVDKDMQINEQLELRFIYSRTEDKVATLCRLLRNSNDTERTIVFVSTKHHVEFFRALLAATGITVSAVYGSMDMTARSHQMGLFKSLKTRVLVVTDLAARGLDLPLVDCVINYDFPHSSKLFIHRVGRTARAGRQGLAISIVTMYDFAYAFEILTAIGRKMVISKEQIVGNEICAIGTVGDITLLVENIKSIIQDDSDIKSLKMSMDASYNLYYKTRPNPSKNAIDRAQQLLKSMGGIIAISNAVHPSYGSEATIAEPDHSDGTEENSKSAILEFLHGFRPSSAKTTIVTSVPASSIATMEKAKMVSQQFRKLDSTISVPGTTQPGEDPSLNDFLVPSAPTNVESHNELKLPQITLNITPDSEELMQKSRFQRKQHWDPKKKKFVQVTVDQMTNRVIKNESGQKAKGGVENQGLLKKWMKTSRKRIQKLGEQEEYQAAPKKKKQMDEDAYSSGDDHKASYDELMHMFPKHAATLEAAKLSLPLTNKQKRTVKRLTTKPDYEKMRPEPAKKATKKKDKRKKRLSQAEFNKKVERKIASRGAPTRSKIIVRKKTR
ncbi:DEAD/DEAH box helicase family protein [Babesia bovis T2Bo]|uniref:RNA helicase n=1 Tax=Babesia bovis TaxID=5865 RepID=A7AWJ7_BABBO|nr:DEAD/DEAH box helicase family protein [Babesia bovis T2Bo]EDO05425.1 DEAD/DEAH box helicase family protein [Babesia bovis T2Bo]|eukprot:XP_001608993.1 DEAD/DEAH box helicase and helicase conserved C-terminal domain containing protein [Babesia bovis T2Bo]